MTVSNRDFPVGFEDFEELRNQGKIYIDKTSYLRDLLTGAVVTLLLRPRRFGKTLSMSMIEKFVEINYLNPDDRSRQEKLFKDLAVYDDTELCDKYMGRYPVISISLKSVKGTDFPRAMKAMLKLLGNLFDKYQFLLNSDKQSAYKKDYLKESTEACFDKKLNLRETDGMDTAIDIAKSSLSHLSNMLYREYGRKVVIIIDEYDVPLQKAKLNGYYNDMLEVVRDMLGNALKTNDNMMRGYVTGCLRIAHQSIFTDINNFDSYGLDDALYSEFIGLTKDETIKLLKKCNMEERLNDVQTWYDGYNMAGNDMLCPWSVLKFMARAHSPQNDPATFMPENYWANSSGNDIIELCMRHPNSSDSQRLQNLIDGKTEVIRNCEFTTCPSISTKTDFNTFATLMLHTGYFTRARDVKSSRENTTVIRIPNEEIRKCFENKAEELFSEGNSEWLEKAYCLRDALFAEEPENVQKIIDSMLMTFISFRDASYESYYHGFMTGVLSMVTTSDLILKSNLESGNGYSDIILTKKEGKIAVILEFKKSDDDRFITQDKVCNDALEQIEKNQYDFHLKQNGCTEILKYGIAFYGKSCTVKMAEQEKL